MHMYILIVTQYGHGRMWNAWGMSTSRRIDMHSMKKVLAMAFFSWYRLTDCHTIGHVMFVWSSVHEVNWCNVHCISCGEYGLIHAEPPSEV